MVFSAMSFGLAMEDGPDKAFILLSIVIDAFKHVYLSCRKGDLHTGYTISNSSLMTSDIARWESRIRIIVEQEHRCKMKRVIDCGPVAVHVSLPWVISPEVSHAPSLSAQDSHT